MWCAAGDRRIIALRSRKRPSRWPCRSCRKSKRSSATCGRCWSAVASPASGSAGMALRKPWDAGVEDALDRPARRGGAAARQVDRPGPGRRRPAGRPPRHDRPVHASTPADEPTQDHTHLIFDLDDGGRPAALPRRPPLRQRHAVRRRAAAGGVLRGSPAWGRSRSTSTRRTGASAWRRPRAA